MRTGVFRDLYVVVGDPQEGGGFALRTHIKPFANWIWAGAIIMALGGALSLSDRRHRIAAGARKTQRAVACGMKRLALILCLLAAPVLAVEPSEMLADPVLEARAQALDQELRCVKCQSEAIASSNAAWAADARVLVRELIADGKSDAEVMDFFVDRYGEYVRMRPAARGAGLVLWIAAPLMLLGGIGIAALTLRRRRAAPEVAALSADEQAHLDELLDS